MADRKPSIVMAAGGVARVLLIAGFLIFAWGRAMADQGVAAPPIPVPEIARRAEDVATQLGRTPVDLRSGPVIDDIERRQSPTGDRIRIRLSASTRIVTSTPSPNALGNLTESWRITRAELVRWNDAVTAHATQLEQRRRDLDTLRATWFSTRDAAVASGAPGPVIERIVTTLGAISDSARAIDQERARVLRLQDNIASDIARCDGMLSDIARARSETVGPLFARDAQPIWDSNTHTGLPTDTAQRLRESVADDFALAHQYVANQPARVAIQLALFVIALVLGRFARDRARRATERGLSEQTISQVFEAPVAAALLLALLATGWIYKDAPGRLIGMVSVLTLVPTVLVMRRLVSPAVLPAVWTLAGFFLVDRLRDIGSPIPELEHWIFFFEMVFSIAFVAVTLRSRAFATRTAALGPARQSAFRWIASAQLAILATALVVGAFGYERLARLLTGGVLGSSYVALVLYAGLRVAEAMIATMLRVRPLHSLFAVRNHRDLLLRRMRAALRWLCITVWAYVALDQLTLMGPIRSVASAVFAARYVRGSVTVSVGDIVAFVVTIWAAFLISSFVRFVLQEDVYPRVGVSRGAPLAVSTLVHYTIVVAGLVVAGASLGVDLNRITIVAGAFSVGVGIGLQGIVANFVSGLVLLLERKINVGDAIQTGDLIGDVRHIGFRASTIKTADGAEVLIPNGRLTSERVVNWTLSDRMRQVTLPVGVAFSSDPARVVELLQAVALAHTKALREPAPVALCVGFGESAVNFELRVWTANFEEAECLRSDLAMAVHAALRGAGIDIPRSRRDIVIRNTDGGLTTRFPEHAAAKLLGSRTAGVGAGD